MNTRPLIRRLLILALLLLGLIVSVLALLNSRAPATSSVELRACLRTADDACLRLPSISGTNLDGQSATFPEALRAPFNFIVMPFDREQQVRAIEWVPVFQELIGADESIDYYSLAALPDLAPAIRLLVSGGMSAAVSDAAVRARTYLFYLEDQAAFLQALNVPDDEIMRVYVVNQAGELLYGGQGDATPEAIAALREAFAALRAAPSS